MALRRFCFILIGATAVVTMAPPGMAKDQSAVAVPQARDTWITTADYPPKALREGAEGVSAIRWDVTMEGRAENCMVTASSGSPELDGAACALIVERARYVPALDRKGRPVRSASTQRVRWQIPADPPGTNPVRSKTGVPYTLQPF